MPRRIAIRQTGYLASWRGLNDGVKSTKERFIEGIDFERASTCFHLVSEDQAVRSCFDIEHGKRRVIVDRLGAEEVHLAGEIDRGRVSSGVYAIRVDLRTRKASEKGSTHGEEEG